MPKIWEKFTNFLKPQNENKKPWWVGVCLQTVDDLVDKIAKEFLFSTCVAVRFTIKKISWYYSNIIQVQLAILNYIVINDNDIIVYYNLRILFTGPIRLILWSSGRPTPTFKYVPTTIMLTIEVGIVVRPSEQNILSVNLLFAWYFKN